METKRGTQRILLFLLSACLLKSQRQKLAKLGGGHGNPPRCQFEKGGRSLSPTFLFAGRQPFSLVVHLETLASVLRDSARVAEIERATWERSSDRDSQQKKIQFSWIESPLLFLAEVPFVARLSPAEYLTLSPCHSTMAEEAREVTQKTFKELNHQLNVAKSPEALSLSNRMEWSHLKGVTLQSLVQLVQFVSCYFVL